MYDLLTATDATDNPTEAKRYMVQLASNALELDCLGIPVPIKYKTVDVCVVGEEREIMMLIAATGYLKGYSVIGWWKPTEDDYAEF